MRRLKPPILSTRSPTFPPQQRHLFKEVSRHQERKAGKGVSTGDSPIPSLATPCLCPNPTEPLHVHSSFSRSRHGVQFNEDWGRGWVIGMDPGSQVTHPQLKVLGCPAVVARVKPRAPGGNAFRISPNYLLHLRLPPNLQRSPHDLTHTTSTHSRAPWTVCSQVREISGMGGEIGCWAFRPPWGNIPPG